MPKLLLKATPVEGNSASMRVMEAFMQTTEDEDTRGWAALHAFAEDVLEWGGFENMPNEVFNTGWRNVCAVLGISV